MFSQRIRKRYNKTLGTTVKTAQCPLLPITPPPPYRPQPIFVTIRSAVLVTFSAAYEYKRPIFVLKILRTTLELTWSVGLSNIRDQKG